VDAGPHSPDEYIGVDAFSKQLRFFFNAAFNFAAPDKQISDYAE